MATLEERVAVLEFLQQEQHGLYIFLINSIIRADPELTKKIAEGIRLVLQNPVETHPISPVLRDQLRSLRDELVRAPDPAVTAAVTKPPVRPV